MIIILIMKYPTAKTNTVRVKERRILMTKCLSLRQPYAELVVSGRKTIAPKIELKIEYLI